MRKEPHDQSLKASNVLFVALAAMQIILRETSTNNHFLVPRVFPWDN
jgi:hypothetical protein